MKIFIICIFFCVNAFSIEAMDDYYANDLLDAVDQAKLSPHHYDYSTTYRYKRTTAQSIELNRLNLSELDETALKSEAGFFEVTEDNDSITIPTDNNGLNNLSDNNPVSSVEKQFIPTTSLPNQSSYTSTYGNFSSSGIQSDSILITTPRP
jgi:hypothetical protein